MCPVRNGTYVSGRSMLDYKMSNLHRVSTHVSVIAAFFGPGHMINRSLDSIAPLQMFRRRSPSMLTVVPDEKRRAGAFEAAGAQLDVILNSRFQWWGCRWHAKAAPHSCALPLVVRTAAYPLIASVPPPTLLTARVRPAAEVTAFYIALTPVNCFRSGALPAIRCCNRTILRAMARTEQACR